jgi:hypothetical protein
MQTILLSRLISVFHSCLLLIAKVFLANLEKFFKVRGDRVFLATLLPSYQQHSRPRLLCKRWPLITLPNHCFSAFYLQWERPPSPFEIPGWSCRTLYAHLRISHPKGGALIFHVKVNTAGCCCYVNVGHSLLFLITTFELSSYNGKRVGTAPSK